MDSRKEVVSYLASVLTSIVGLRYPQRFAKSSLMNTRPRQYFTKLSSLSHYLIFRRSLIHVWPSGINVVNLGVSRQRSGLFAIWYCLLGFLMDYMCLTSDVSLMFWVLWSFSTMLNMCTLHRYQFEDEYFSGWALSCPLNFIGFCRFGGRWFYSSLFFLFFSSSHSLLSYLYTDLCSGHQHTAALVCPLSSLLFLFFFTSNLPGTT